MKESITYPVILRRYSQEPGDHFQTNKETTTFPEKVVLMKYELFLEMF